MNLHQTILNNKSIIISLLILTLVFVIGQWFQSDFIFNRDQINVGSIWKIVSGNFTHSNVPHLLLNLSGLWILGWLFIDNLTTKVFISSIIFLSFAVGLGLYFFTPDIIRYYGFSGILYGLYLVAAISALLKNDVFTGLSVALLVSVKIIWDYFTGGDQTSAELIGVPVANDAHLYGFLGALVIVTYMLMHWEFNKRNGHPPPF